MDSGNLPRSHSILRNSLIVLAISIPLSTEIIVSLFIFSRRMISSIDLSPNSIGLIFASRLFKSLSDILASIPR